MKYWKWYNWLGWFMIVLPLIISAGSLLYFYTAPIFLLVSIPLYFLFAVHLYGKV